MWGLGGLLAEVYPGWVLDTSPQNERLEAEKWWFLIGISFFQGSIFRCHVCFGMCKVYPAPRGNMSPEKWCLEDVSFLLKCPPLQQKWLVRFQRGKSWRFWTCHGKIMASGSRSLLYIHICECILSIYLYMYEHIYIYKYPHMFKKYRVVVVFNVEAYPFLGWFTVYIYICIYSSMVKQTYSWPYSTPKKEIARIFDQKLMSKTCQNPGSQ